MSDNCYDSAPEFIDEDNRRSRTRNPVSKQQMHNKHAVLLPPELVKGKTVLDLGCCMGATGHWVLSHGASHYTGVEFQSAYTEKASALLNKYHPGKATIHQMAIEEWLMQPNKPTFDIVCILGVIYAFVDYFSILKLATSITKSTLIIESLYFGLLKKKPDFAGVAFIDDQTINLATEESSLLGRGSRVSPKGFEWLLKEFGFTCPDGILYPKPIIGSMDIYNRPLELLSENFPVRFLMRFVRSDVSAHSLSKGLQFGVGKKEVWEP